ncbi:rhodanese-like domain-containing protein [Macrococcoides caseolyticum]|uniref:rhodanese-like domain-containing protein n=1 Tax=Macrococcoides caseolyticum TaxID=69966 RepID=UPI001F4124C6|nr:rhodanese-like domain-containing protein [Macrococcus caseolyticus]MCE4956575.1 rhodanese-like domain-containing protein [Macrococcus caseolyticus]
MENFQTIDVETLKTLLDSENINLIDVREVFEYDDNHIDQAINIPLSVLGENTDQFDRNQHYHIICRSGNRSAHACQYLSGLGIETTNIEGGMIDWEAI